MKRIARLPILAWVILLGGFALRLVHLGADSLWYDETVSLTLAQSDVPELIRHTAADIHPPFYYLLLHFWGQLAGWSEFASAFLSLLFGVLLIALVYRVARALVPGDRRVSGIVALLVAVSPYNVWYSQEVRMYTLGAVLGLASVYFLWRMLGAARVRALDWLGYVLVTVLGVYTLYYFLFLIAFEYVLVAAYWWRVRRRTMDAQQGWVQGRKTTEKGLSSFVFRLSSFFFAQLAIAVLYLPWLPIAFHQATDPPVPPWRSATPVGDALLNAFSALTLGESVEPLAVLPFLALALGVMIYLFVRPGAGNRRQVGLMMAAYTFVPLLLILLASLRTPLFHPRYIFTYSPGFYILLALAIDTISIDLARRRAFLRMGATAAVVGVIILGAAYSLDHFWSDPNYAEDDLRGAAAHLAENWRSGDAILVNAGYAYTAVAYYAPELSGARSRLTGYVPASGDADSRPLLLQTGSIGGSLRLGWGDPLSDFYPTTADETRAALDRVFQAHPRVWMLRIYDTVTDPDGVIRKYFADHGRLIDDSPYSGGSNLRVQGYLTRLPDALPVDAIQVEATLADRVELLGYRGPRVYGEKAGRRLDLTLYWQLVRSVNFNYQLSVQVLGAGQVAAQRDERPLGDALPMTRWKMGEIYPEPVSLNIAALSPGRYTLIVKLYNLDSGEVLDKSISLQDFVVGQ